MKQIFPEMKLRILVPNFCILVYSQDGSYLESLFFRIAWENSWLNSRSKKKGRELAPSWMAAVPCPPLRSCGWAESTHNWPTNKFPIWKIWDHKWKKVNPCTQCLIWFESEWDSNTVRHVYGILTSPSFAVYGSPYRCDKQ